MCALIRILYFVCGLKNFCLCFTSLISKSISKSSITKSDHGGRSRNRGGLPRSRLHRRVYGRSLALYPHKLGVTQDCEIKERAMPAQFIVKEGMQGQHPE